MVKTIIHGARIGGRGPNEVQHTGIKFPSYCGGGGGAKWTGAAGLLPRCEIFLVRTLRYTIFLQRRTISQMPDCSVCIFRRI